jgi:hypothetical protein
VGVGLLGALDLLCEWMQRSCRQISAKEVEHIVTLQAQALQAQAELT